MSDNRPMNLYIWGDSGTVSYGADALIVMAPDLRTARKIAAKAENWAFGRSYGELVDRSQTRKPDRVIRNRPYAAYFMVQE